MSKKKLFALSTALTTCAMLCILYVQRPDARPAPVLVSSGIFVSPQISLRDVGFNAQRGMRTIIDMRPDGEALDEPGHIQIEQTARARGLDFRYIPVPHESIPPETVKALGDALSSSEKPAVLYCRTGRRAVRTYALVEASRNGGPSADAILAMVAHARFSAEDLRPEIISRIAARTSVPETKR